MPRRPKQPCSFPGCPNLTSKKYCSLHEKLGLDNRETAAARGYDQRWRKARLMFLKKNPLCMRCMNDGRYVRATVVDHINPHRGDQSLFWDESNWQALCKKCHDRKTMTIDRQKEYRY